MSSGVLPSAHTGEALANLLRGFAVEFLTCQRWEVLPRVMAPDYRLNVGGFVIAGRDDQYRAAMLPQFEQFPGLCVTVHQVVLGEQAVAMRFTEHGASGRDAGRRAAWQGVSMFRIVDGQMKLGWAEEDYIARKRQLRSGVCDRIEEPYPAPWDARVEPASPAAEVCATAWLQRAVFSFSASADAPASSDHDPATLIKVAATEIDELFSAGDHVAFHTTYRGVYAGGFADVDRALIGTPVTLRAAGILTVQNGSVVDVRIVTDRLGLYRTLRPR